MKLGCHAVLFKDRIATDTKGLLTEIRETGFSGAEIGSRFFGTDKKEYLGQILNDTDMLMSGMHATCILTDLLDKKQEVVDGFIKVVDFIKDMKEHNIILTGLHKWPMDNPNMDIRLTDPNSVEMIARELNELALLAKEQGVRVHYHNHSWEFDNDALIFNSIGKYAPDLYFGLDTGWAFSSGYDPVELMNQYPGRFHYVHLRDYDKATKQFVALGSGDMDYIRLTNKLKEVLDYEDWAIVEYETGDEDMNRYKLAYEYITKYMK